MSVGKKKKNEVQTVEAEICMAGLGKTYKTMNFCNV